MAKARRLALLVFVALLAGCGGSSAPEPPHGGAVLRLTIPAAPATLDPAKVADLPSLNVVHELNAGLTRFSGSGVEPDLAESWEPSENGLVWTFHLRKGIRWSNDVPITAEDFRRSWLRALAPATRSAYARAEMQNIRGARRYRVTGSGEVGVQAVDAHTLRVTLQHPVPWLDEQVAWPVFFPVPRSGTATSGPFRLASRTQGRLVLDRNFNYWNVAAVKPRRVVLTTSFRHVDGYLPRSRAAPGFQWVQNGVNPQIAKRALPRLAVELLWLVTKGTALADPQARAFVNSAIDRPDLVRRAALRTAGGERAIDTVMPPAMPGPDVLTIRRGAVEPAPRGLRLTLAYSVEDVYGEAVAIGIRGQLYRRGVQVELKPVASLRDLAALAGPPAKPGIDMVLLGWSPEFFDEYNILDLFPCGSAFNVAQWCDRGYDLRMGQAVRELDDGRRYKIERFLLQELRAAVPAVPLFSASDNVFFEPGVGGFRWSPIGFYELMGMTRS
jgi:oligopeptide transport system substrate-binding protein